jgi:hypothetical protein
MLPGGTERCMNYQEAAVSAYQVRDGTRRLRGRTPKNLERSAAVNIVATVLVANGTEERDNGRTVELPLRVVNTRRELERHIASQLSDR